MKAQKYAVHHKYDAIKLFIWRCLKRTQSMDYRMEMQEFFAEIVIACQLVRVSHTIWILIERNSIGQMH